MKVYFEYMNARTKQREDTRDRIVHAALEAFAELGFKAASTREIAKRARTTQGLITYHFRTKDQLWKAAVGEIFDRLRAQLAVRFESLDRDDVRPFAREAIREYVRFVAAHPELFRLMVETGKRADARMRWLVDTYLKPAYGASVEAGLLPKECFDEALLPHAHYVLAGAGSVIFAVAPECERLTGVDPTRQEFVEAHADFVARLLVP